MKSKYKKILLALQTLGAWAVPGLVLAQGAVGRGLERSGVGSMFGNSDLTTSRTVSELIISVIHLMLIFAGMIAVVFVIIGGYYYVTAQGNEEQAEKGKNTLINAIIGIVVIIMAYVIIDVVTNLVASNAV